MRAERRGEMTRQREQRNTFEMQLRNKTKDVSLRFKATQSPLFSETVLLFLVY